MNGKFLIAILALLCMVSATSGILMAEQAQWGMGGQSLEETEQALQKGLQDGSISQAEYDIAMKDANRMKALSQGDQQRVSTGLQSWKE